MIKYKVSIGYFEFVFDDADDAVRFALMAKTHQISDNSRVTIDFEKSEEVEND